MNQTFQKKIKVCALLIGGARESIESYPDKYRLILNRRKGFCRLALETGSCLVPVISFGENNTYLTVQNPKGSRLRGFQEYVLKTFLIGAPILMGRGIFNYSLGVLPFRGPIVTVVGKPIDVQKVIKPTKERVEALHEVYKQELIKLFNENKEKYLKNKNVEVELID
jgi:1-acyl-sn-glycerol-3-phosphate acyltransferase